MGFRQTADYLQGTQGLVGIYEVPSDLGCLHCGRSGPLYGYLDDRMEFGRTNVCGKCEMLDPLWQRPIWYKRAEGREVLWGQMADCETRYGYGYSG